MSQFSAQCLIRQWTSLVCVSPRRPLQRMSLISHVKGRGSMGRVVILWYAGVFHAPDNLEISILANQLTWTHLSERGTCASRSLQFVLPEESRKIAIYGEMNPKCEQSMFHLLNVPVTFVLMDLDIIPMSTVKVEFLREMTTTKKFPYPAQDLFRPWLCLCGVDCPMTVFSFSDFFCRLCAAIRWQTFPAHIECDAD